MKKRRQVWQLLDNHVGSLPTRSSIILAGDFNCVLPAAPPCVEWR